MNPIANYLLLILLLSFVFLSIFVKCAPPMERNKLEKEPFPNPDKFSANRPDHLKGIALERDGELNKDFRKELLSDGTDHESVGHVMEDGKEAEKIVEDMFRRADTNNDDKLSEDELKAQIKENTRKHLEEGRQQSERLFQKVDENGDGVVKWNEYKAHFMVKNEMVDEEHAKEHANEHEENVDANSRLKLADELEAFKKADADNNGLDEIEWLGFQHPENSKTMLNEMTHEILKSFDRDNDQHLSVDEFARLPEGVVDNPEMDREYVEARKHEFNNVIDLDKDGLATIEELRSYVDPLNEYHVVEEVREIFEFADTDKDGFLTLDELLKRAEILVSSGFIHPRARLHDDL